MARHSGSNPFVKHGVTNGPPVGPVERERAIRQVAQRCLDTADFYELVDMLDLRQAVQDMQIRRDAA